MASALQPIPASGISQEDAASRRRTLQATDRIFTVNTSTSTRQGVV